MTEDELRERFDHLLAALEVIANGFDEGDTEELFGVKPGDYFLNRAEMIKIAESAIIWEPS